MEAKNIARCGCVITNGIGLGVVFDIGDYTLFGKIARSTTSIEKPQTLIKKEINRLIWIMVWLSTILGVIFFTLARLSKYSW